MRIRCRQVSDVVSLALPRRRGGVVVGLPDGLHFLNGEQSIGLVAIESERTDTRTNDGACDAAGRLWVGTMALDERSPAGALYRVDPDLQRDDHPHRDHDLERARLEPVGDTLLLHRQPDLPRATSSTATWRLARSRTGGRSPPSSQRGPSPTA